MAEGIIKKLLPEEYREKIEVQSAGTLALDGQRASEHAMAVAKEHGIDISEHRSQSLRKELVEDADIILAMAEDHREYLEMTYPHVRENVFLLKTFDRPNKRGLRSLSIPDPIGRDRPFYRRVFRQLEKELQRILPRILKLADEKLRNRDDLFQDA